MCLCIYLHVIQALLSIAFLKSTRLTLFHPVPQPPQEENKEGEITKEPEEAGEVKKEEEAVEKKEEEAAKEEETKGRGDEKEKEKDEEEAKKEKPAKDKKAEKKTEAAKGSKRQKTMQCKVTLLDDTQFECELDVRRCSDRCLCWKSPSERTCSQSLIPARMCVCVTRLETCKGPRTSDKGVRPPQPDGEGLLWARTLGFGQQQGTLHPVPVRNESNAWRQLSCFALIFLRPGWKPPKRSGNRSRVPCTSLHSA